MSKQVRAWGLLALAAVAALALVAGQGQAGGDKAVFDAVDKIAASLKKGDKDGAAKGAQALAKKIDMLEEVMHMLTPRKKGGKGVGKPGQVTPDGIELKLISLGRDAPTAAALNKEAAAIEEMAYTIAALAEVTKYRAPTTDKGKKTKKDWLVYTEDMRVGAHKLAEAAAKKGAQDVKAAASKLNTSCNTCHSTFR